MCHENTTWSLFVSEQAQRKHSFIFPRCAFACICVLVVREREYAWKFGEILCDEREIVVLCVDNGLKLRCYDNTHKMGGTHRDGFLLNCN